MTTRLVRFIIRNQERKKFFKCLYRGLRVVVFIGGCLQRKEDAFKAYLREQFVTVDASLLSTKRFLGLLLKSLLHLLVCLLPHLGGG